MRWTARPTCCATWCDLCSDRSERISHIATVIFHIATVIFHIDTLILRSCNMSIRSHIDTVI